MFQTYQIIGHNYFIINLDDSPKLCLWKCVYEDVALAKKICEKANAEAWDDDMRTMLANFKIGKWFFVTDKSEKYNIRYVGKLHRESDTLVPGTVRFTADDLVLV